MIQVKGTKRKEEGQTKIDHRNKPKLCAKDLMKDMTLSAVPWPRIYIGAHKKLALMLG